VPHALPNPLHGIAAGFRRFKLAPWWVHSLATLAACVVVLATAVIVLGALYLDYTREHSPLESGIPTQTEPEADERLELARRFAPVLRYDSRELFAPMPIAGYVSRTQLAESEGKFTRVIRERLTADDLPTEEGACLKSRGCLAYLDVRGVEPDPPKDSQAAYDRIENEVFRGGVEPTVYAHVTRYEDSGDYAVQYWFLYAHEGGNTSTWERAERDGDHVVVYPALGSHANYFTRGRHRVSVGCKRVIGSIQRCIRGRELLVDLADGNGRVLGPSDYRLVEFTEPVFVGSYGTGNYVILTRQPSVLADPRTRTLWKDPLRPLR
jgi:hypothetical protein